MPHSHLCTEYEESKGQGFWVMMLWGAAVILGRLRLFPDFQIYRGMQDGFVMQGVVFKAWGRLREREPGPAFLVGRVGLK